MVERQVAASNLKEDHMFKLSHSKFARVLSIVVIGCVAATALGAGGVAFAKVTKPGSNSGKHPPLHGPGSSHNPIVWHPPLHGPGSSHNPIIQHPPLHGAGSSHNPIVVPPNCNDPNTLCRRP
jgi:hypothetical protein